MNSKCEKCGGELIEGSMTGMHGVFFYPDGEINKLKPKRSPVICYCCKRCGNCCKRCGMIQGFTATQPEKLDQ